MITKTQLLSTLETMPENLAIDEVIDRIIFLEKVQKGIEDSQAGRVHTKEQAKEKLKKWLK